MDLQINPVQLLQLCKAIVVYVAAELQQAIGSHLCLHTRLRRLRSAQQSACTGHISHQQHILTATCHGLLRFLLRAHLYMALHTNTAQHNRH